MKTSKLQKLAWVFFALALTSTSVFAQGWGNRNRVINIENRQTCLEVITGLTENQKAFIVELEKKHNETMDGLRTQRRNTRNTYEKNQIRNEMDKLMLAHQNEVKTHLTEKQKEQYDALHVNGGQHKNQNNWQGNFGRRGNFSSNNNNRRNFSQAGFRNRSNNFQGRNGFSNDQNCFQLTFNEPLSKSETEGLLLMREQEKMANDVYLFFENKYGLPAFRNISSSEARHGDAILNLINGYDLEDPTSNVAGEFKNKEVQKLYSQLIQDGDKSLSEALMAGALVEEQDIAGLQRLLDETTNKDVQLVYSNLLRASEVHLRTFTNLLEAQGTTYSPEILSQEAYQSVTQANNGYRNNNFAARGNNYRRNNAGSQRGYGRGAGRGNRCFN